MVNIKHAQKFWSCNVRNTWSDYHFENCLYTRIWSQFVANYWITTLCLVHHYSWGPPTCMIMMRWIDADDDDDDDDADVDVSRYSKRGLYADHTLHIAWRCNSIYSAWSTLCFTYCVLCIDVLTAKQAMDALFNNLLPKWPSCYIPWL